MDASTAMVMGLPTSSPQKEKAVAFLWDQRVDGKCDWEREQGMGGREDQRKTRPGQALHPAGFTKPHPSYSGEHAWVIPGPTLIPP